jgi:putative acetyltransferase
MLLVRYLNAKSLYFSLNAYTQTKTEALIAQIIYRALKFKFYISFFKSIFLVKDSIKIRPIQPEDNTIIADVIRYVLIEQNAPKTGTAFEDSALDDMYGTYDIPRAEYFILVEDDQILGGAGIQAIATDNSICELQKMYFHPKARGRGLGQQMMDVCLQFAKSHHYKSCYIETLTEMKAAQNLYLKNGFEYISERLGATGHHSCPVWMLKSLV